ncbi:MAG: hypothetical protein C4K60_19490 [Ideonella sp. MAG2]|nr:MAG: hypothetical protein C4K60_19490 [Ideonella sp. MAG2]
MFSTPPPKKSLLPALRRWVPWLRRRQPPEARPSRLEVKPPALWGQAEPVWLSLWHWLREDAATEPMEVPRLELARQDFCAALYDFRGEDAEDLTYRAKHARSLRELWHLRAELYHLIACRFNQHEADRRMATVNQHFPVGTPGGRPYNSRTTHGHDHLT